MPPLLLPSPVLVDHTFPRDDYQLRLVASALGEVVAILEQNRAQMLLTDTLREMVQEFDWNRPQTLVHEIYRLLAQLFLQSNNMTVNVDLSGVGDHERHPVPRGTEEQGLVEFWADEIGKILLLHDQCGEGAPFFIGVASEYAFGGEPLNEYNNPTSVRVFPLVGPDNLEILIDAYEYEIPQNLHLSTVSFDDAKRNVYALGAIRVRKPPGGSHYKVEFEGSRSWALDYNVDPQPDRFLKELVAISGYPFEVVKVALLTGELPPLVLKLSRVATCSTA